MPRTTFIDRGNNKVIKDIPPTISKYKTDRHVSIAQVIEKSGMSQANFYKAWNDPSLFRIGQLIRIYDFLKVPEAERRFI